MNTNVIDDLSKLAVKPSGKVVGVPAIRHAIQCSPQHIELAEQSNVAKKGFPLIDRMAFKRTYRDKEYDIDLPVFGFFNVLREPVLKFAFERGPGGVRQASDNSFQFYFPNNLAKPIQITSGLQCDDVDKIDPKEVAKFLPPPLPMQKFDSKDVMRSQLMQYSQSSLLGGQTSLLDQSISVMQVTFEAKLQHIIPDEIMLLVDKHLEEKTFNSSLYIVADVQNQWTMESRQVVMNPDPLLVGVDRGALGKVYYYLVAKFDLTPAESYITKEFVK